MLQHKTFFPVLEKTLGLQQITVTDCLWRREGEQNKKGKKRKKKWWRGRVGGGERGKVWGRSRRHDSVLQNKSQLRAGNFKESKASVVM